MINPTIYDNENQTDEIFSVDDLDFECKTFNYQDYFEITSVNGVTKSKCIITSCNRTLSGSMKGNLMRHLRTMRKLDLKDAQQTNDSIHRVLKIKISPNTVYSACIEMCTINGRPLAAIDDSGFRKLLKPILDAFRRTGIILTLSPPVIHEYLSIYANRVRNEIKNEINGIMLCVKMDIVKRLRRSILGINIQFIKDDKIVIRTLDMFETKSSHTGEYICSCLLRTLSDYGISQQQVYSITTDNGANIVKSVDMFCELAQTENLFFNDFDNILQNTLIEDEDGDDEDGNDEDYDDAGLSREVFQNVVRIFQNKSVTKGLPCATHTIQLIVNYVFGPKSELPSAKLVQKFRKVSYMMGKSNILLLIRAKKLPFPKRDTVTRWSSYYYMLERMRLLRSFYEENESLILGKKSNRKLNENDWVELDSILKVLKLFERITTRLQAEKLTPSDFFASWEELKFEMADFKGELADALRTGMKHREPELFNDLVYACVYLDPRYKVLLNQTQKDMAIEHLRMLWEQLSTWRNTDETNSTVNSDQNSNNDLHAPRSKFEAHLQEMERQRIVNDKPTFSSCNIVEKLILFDAEYGSFKKDAEHTIDFWKRYEVKRKYREIYQLSILVNAVPVTQVTVERAFSIVAFILSNRRCQLSEKTLNDVLLIRLNKQLFDKIICIE